MPPCYYVLIQEATPPGSCDPQANPELVIEGPCDPSLVCSWAGKGQGPADWLRGGSRLSWVTAQWGHSPLLPLATTTSGSCLWVEPWVRGTSYLSRPRASLSAAS